MPSFGETLRRERELRGVDLRDIAEATNISLRFLQALEQDRMDVLPDKPRYQPGDVASLQVRSPFREATAWVNVMPASASAC